MTLQSVDRTGNGFCGPLVLAAIFGCDTAEAAARIRQATSSSRPVKGMHNFELERTLSFHGYRAAKCGISWRYRADLIPGQCGTHVDNTMERRASLEEYHRVKRMGGCVHAADGRMPLMITNITGVSGQQDWAAPFTPVKMVGPTLAEWIRTYDRDPNAFYIVEVNLHYVLVKGRKFVDTFTKGEWVFTGSAPHRRKRVKNVWKVTKS